MNSDAYLFPEWPAPKNIRAANTTRLTGYSQGAFAGLNLGFDTGDDRDTILKNRAQLAQDLKLPSAPQWVHQTHGVKVANFPSDSRPVEADASTTSDKGIVLAIMTADCLPILICDQLGTQIAAIHAGWRSLSGGVIENTISSFSAATDSLLIWFGPSISVRHFEVGQDVFDRFCQNHPDDAIAFHPHPNNEKYFADIVHLAKLRLQRLGVQAIYGGDHCTFSEQDRFYSYRRDATTGRMASLIWME